MSTTTGLFYPSLKRELAIYFRRPGDLLNPILFFGIVTSLFPLALSPDPSLLRQLAPGLIWINALLAMVLSLDQLFNEDQRNGSLEQLYASGCDAYLVVCAKLCAYWLSFSLPLILVAPLLASSLHLANQQLPILMLSLLLGTPSLCLLGGLGVALTLGSNQQNLLIALLVLPLTVPILIFGSHCCTLPLSGQPIGGPLALLAGLMLFCLCGLPWAITSVLKYAVCQS